jgi:DNA-binding MarR family transcriptional regulator
MSKVEFDKSYGRILGNDGCSQQQLAVSSLRDRANVTRIIDILEREGIVKRMKHETDCRIFKILITEKGKALEKDAMVCGQSALDDALNGVSKSGLEVCMEVLNKTIVNLQINLDPDMLNMLSNNKLNYRKGNYTLF